MLVWKKLLEKIRKPKNKKSKIKLVKKVKNDDANSAETSAKIYEPYSGQGSAINYYEKSHNIKYKPVDGQNDTNYASKTYKELLPHFLLYVLKSQSDGLYEKGDKVVQEYFKLSSDDKPNRVKKLAVQNGFLVSTTKKSTYEVREEKIREYLERVSV